MILTITFALGHNDYIKNHGKHPFQNCQDFTLTGYVHEYDNVRMTFDFGIEIYTFEKLGLQNVFDLKCYIINFHFTTIVISEFHLGIGY